MPDQTVPADTALSESVEVATITYGGEACTPDGGFAAVPYRIRIERGGSDVALTCSARFARSVAVHCDAERLAGADVLIRWPHACFPNAAEVGRLIEAAMGSGVA